MKTIPVKIGWDLVIPIILIVSLPNLLMIGNVNGGGFLMPVAVLGFTLTLIFGIRYQIDSENLYIKNSVFGTTTIPIKEINRVEKTRSILASPAPSISGRIQVFYNNDSIIISPKNIQQFNNELLRINPGVVIKE